MAKYVLLVANILLAVFFVIAPNVGVLPLSMGDFIFFAILALAFAFYRPGWMFLLFVGATMFENANLAPDALGIAVRPYQLFGGSAIAAIIIGFLIRRPGLKLAKLSMYDWAAIVLGISGFLSAAFSNEPGAAFKQSIIMASFIALYFLVRNYIENEEDLEKVIPFFLSSSAIVAGYGIWQNMRFSRGLPSFEVMPGRPNATFSEPDWLGMFIVLMIAAIYGLIFYASRKKSFVSRIVLYVLLIISYVSLILTVSRSAWLGALAVTFVFLVAVFTQLKISPRNWRWKETAMIKIPILISIVASIAIVYFFNLTTFQLSNRVQSTSTGLQKITVSCWKDEYLPQEIISSDELIKYGCRHINLEEIGIEKGLGNFIKETYRKDPNVNIRQEIYRKSWEELKNNPIFGIGWGNISNILGKDERGAGLNSSNIFLEAWLGAGILGLMVAIMIFIGAIIRGLKLFMSSEDAMRSVGMFILLGSIAIIVPNFFNAGMMLGFLWLFLGIGQVKSGRNS